VRIFLANIEALLHKKRKNSCMKVIGFRPKNGFAPVMEKFERAVVSLGVSRTDLAMEAFGAGLEPAIRTLAERRRREAVDTLKRLKIAKVTIPGTASSSTR
jgi:ribosomal protein S11